MSGASSIKRLPPELRKELDRLLGDGRLTIREITAHMQQLGASVSKSSVGRYSQDYERVAANIRMAREMAQAIGRELDVMSDGDAGRLAIESLQATLLRVQMRLVEDDELDAKMIADLARAAKDLASGMKSSVEVEIKVRDRAAREAARAAETTARSEGLSESTVEKIKASILGIARRPS